MCTQTGFDAFDSARGVIQSYILRKSFITTCTCSYHAAWPRVARGEVDDLVVLWPQHSLLLIAVLMEDKSTKCNQNQVVSRLNMCFCVRWCYKTESVWQLTAKSPVFQHWVIQYYNASLLISLCWIFLTGQNLHIQLLSWKWLTVSANIGLERTDTSCIIHWLRKQFDADFFTLHHLLSPAVEMNIKQRIKLYVTWSQHSDEWTLLENMP